MSHFMTTDRAEEVDYQVSLPEFRQDEIDIDVDVTQAGAELRVRACHETTASLDSQRDVPRQLIPSLPRVEVVRLPSGVNADRTEARFEGGVLTIRVAKLSTHRVAWAH